MQCSSTNTYEDTHMWRGDTILLSGNVVYLLAERVAMQHVWAPAPWFLALHIERNA